MEKQIMILVKALKGTKCPKENAPRDYITDETAEEVPATAYYRRLLNDGSLVTEQTAKTPGKK